MNDSWSDDDEGANPAPLKRLTREEVLARIKKDPPVSPWRVVAAQAVAAMLCAALVWGITRRDELAWSALYGGLAIVVPSALLARGMTRRSLNAVSAAAGFLFWEMVKIGVAVAMLLLAPRIVPQLSWPALLVAMVVCIKVNWLALLWRGRKQS